MWHCGHSYERGRRKFSVGLPWPCQTVSPAMPHTTFQCSGQLWLLWVVRRPLFLFLVGPMCWVTITTSIWEVGTVASWFSTQYSSSVSWSDACKSYLLPSLDLWIRSWWRNLLSRGWRRQIIATGWCRVPFTVVPLLQESSRCRRFLRSTATSWEYGLSSLSTLRRLGEGTTATA